MKDWIRRSCDTAAESNRWKRWRAPRLCLRSIGEHTVSQEWTRVGERQTKGMLDQLTQNFQLQLELDVHTMVGQAHVIYAKDPGPSAQLFVSFRQRCLLEESGLFLPWRSREDTAHRGATDV